MSHDLFDLLREATLAGSAAIVLVLLLRGPLRAMSGARAAYALWLLVPVALSAILVPAAAQVEAARSVVAASVPSVVATATMATSNFDPVPPLLLGWAMGVFVMAFVLMRQQRRFLRSLGPLRERGDGRLQSDAVAGLPAVIGWRARVVLPGDFEQRYEAAAQPLVLCHEDVHRRRGDLPVNFLVSALRCLFWFNPLVHAGASRLRDDQELACDEVVLRRFPHQRRVYGDALLRTELAELPLPVGCHWFGSHPLKERITMLKRPLPNKPRWFAGVALVAVITLGGGFAAWAAQPARSPSVAAPAEGELGLTMQVILDGQGKFAERQNVGAGQPHTFEYEHDGQQWAILLKITPLDDGTLFADAEITRDGVSQGKPKLVFKPGEKGAAIGIGQEKPGEGFKGIAIELSVVLPRAQEAGNTPVAPSVVPAKVALARPVVDMSQPWKLTPARLWQAPAAEEGC